MTSEALFTGTTRFSVQQSLGSGSFGTVYEALDLERNTLVALKVPHDFRALNLLLFKQEFRSLAEVAHPNLVTLLELIGEEGTWFFTMERVSGVDCFTYLRSASDRKRPSRPRTLPYFNNDSHTGIGSFRTLPSLSSFLGGAPGEQVPAEPSFYSAPPDYDRVRRVFRQMTEGLLALHQASLVHRDLKPSNVLVTPEERVVILDFGLVLPTEEGAPVTEESLKVAGTPAYVAPEQLDGQPATQASDWYSLGVMLYQALTGCLPHTGNYLEIIRAKRDMDPCPPSLLVPETPADLDSLCLDLMMRDPEARLQGMAVLERLQDGQTVPFFAPPRPHDDLDLPGSRLAELQALNRAYQLSRLGQPVVVTLHGEPGLGKSTLVRRFLREAKQAEPRSLHLRARCYEQESVPFKAVDGLVDHLCHVLRRLQATELEALLPDHVGYLSKLFPVLNQVGPIAERARLVTDLPDRQELRQRAFQAFRDLLTHLAHSRPVILVIDDLQWGDLDSTALLLELLQPSAGLPVLLLLSFHTADRDRIPLLTALHQPERGVLCPLVDVELGLLTETESQVLARQMLANHPQTEAAAAWVAREAGGHPFFLSELAHAVAHEQVQPGSPLQGLDQYLHLRVSRMEAPARHLLSLLAVSGHPLEWSLLAEASGLGGQADALLPLLRNGHFVRIQGSSRTARTLEPFHVRLQASVARNLPAEAQAQLHRELAEGIERLQPDEILLLARHYHLASVKPKAAHYARLAGTRAMQALAFDQAASFFQQALQHTDSGHPDRGALWQALGEALALAGRSPEAAQAYLQAADLAPGEAATNLQRRAAEAFFRAGLVQDGLETLRQELQRHSIFLPQQTATALFCLLCSRLILSFQRETPTLRPASQIPGQDLDRIDLLWLLAMGLGPIDILRGAHFQARQLRLTLAAGEPHRMVRGLAHEIIFQSLPGNRNLMRTQALMDRLQALAQELDHPEALGRTAIAFGLAAVFQGRWAAAATHLESAEQQLREQCVGMDYEVHLAQHHSLLAHAVLGNLNQVMQRLPQLIRETRSRGDLLALTNLRAGLAHYLYEAQDDPEGGLAEVNEAMTHWAQGDFQSVHYHELVARVELLLYAQRPEEAHAFLNKRWGALRRSTLLFGQAIRITCLELKARVRIFRLNRQQGHNLRSGFQRQRINTLVRRIRREHTPYGEALALRLQTALFVLDGQWEAASQTCARAEQHFEACGMSLAAAACAWSRGHMSEDPELLHRAEATLRAQGIVAPERWAARYIPIGSRTRPVTSS